MHTVTNIQELKDRVGNKDQGCHDNANRAKASHPGVELIDGRPLKMEKLEIVGICESCDESEFVLLDQVTSKEVVVCTDCLNASRLLSLTHEKWGSAEICCNCIIYYDRFGIVGAATHCPPVGGTMSIADYQVQDKGLYLLRAIDAAFADDFTALNTRLSTAFTAFSEVESFLNGIKNRTTEQPTDKLLTQWQRLGDPALGLEAWIEQGRELDRRGILRVTTQMSGISSSIAAGKIVIDDETDQVLVQAD